MFEAMHSVTISAFLKAITARPHEASLRMVFADWLEERGDKRFELWRNTTPASVLVRSFDAFDERHVDRTLAGNGDGGGSGYWSVRGDGFGCGRGNSDGDGGSAGKNLTRRTSRFIPPFPVAPIQIDLKTIDWERLHSAVLRAIDERIMRVRS